MGKMPYEPPRFRRLPAAERRAAEETSERLLAMVGDPDGRVARARLRADWADAVYQTRSNLLPLDVEALVAVLTADDLERLAAWLRDMRAWQDAMEQAVAASQQLRVVGGRDG